MAPTQDGRRLKVKTPLGKDVLLLSGFTGQEAISRPFSFQLQCISENPNKVPFEALLGQKITAEVSLPGGAPRWFNGTCLRVAQGGRDETFTGYVLDLVPTFFLLSKKTQSRIFQHKKIPDILKEVLTGLDVTYQLQGTYEPRDYCVQYRESDFAFASRLMEEEGIYYFFKHSDGGHNMVVADKPAGHPDVAPGKSTLKFDPVGGGTRDDDRVHVWEKTQDLRSSKVTLFDHCFELPHKHLDANQTILASVAAGKSSHKLLLGANGPLELYDFPGAYAQRFDGVNKGGGDQPAELQKIFSDNVRTVDLRMKAEAAASVLVHGSSNCRQLVSGHKFTLTGHFEGDGPWVLYQVEHVASEATDVRSGAGSFSYQNHFSCFPPALPFHPPRLTPIPTVKGTQTAVVVGPKGEEILTDKYGRVKVQFHWDRQGKNDTDSSCWIRVAQPIAGRRWGASFWPRIGQEVIVDFLEGDPDQPIIVGSVYNADQMPPYLGNGPDPKHKNDNKLTGVKSDTSPDGEGFNEWRFDDTKGKQQLFLHAERNMDTRVKSDSMESVGGSKHLTVGGEKDGKTWGDYKELVYKDVHLHNKGDLNQAVGGNLSVTVGAESSEPGDFQLIVKGDRGALVEQLDAVHVKGNRIEKVDGAQSLSVGGDQHEKVGQNHALDAEMAIHLKAGMNVVIEAGVQLSLKVGGNFIDISPAGVAISGTLVLINSGGAAGSGPGAHPQSVVDVHPPLPEDPTPADNAKTGYKSCP